MAPGKVCVSTVPDLMFSSWLDGIGMKTTE